MSERGSFVTEYIYCEKCLDAAKKHLLGKDKYLCSQTIEGWRDDTLPIVAGKIGGSYSGEEIVEFDTRLREALEVELCHGLRVAVLAEVGQSILFFEPKGKNNG